MHSTTASSASPGRLSPREVSKASPQTDRSTIYSVPQDKHCPSAQWLLTSTNRYSTWVFNLRWTFLPGHVLAALKWLCFSAFYCQLWNIQLRFTRPLQSFCFIHSYILWHWLAFLLRVQVLCKIFEPFSPSEILVAQWKPESENISEVFFQMHRGCVMASSDLPMLQSSSSCSEAPFLLISVIRSLEWWKKILRIDITFGEEKWL